MAEKKPQWVIRDQQGRIFGPLDESRILASIDSGQFTGSEELAEYPGGSWRRLSRENKFADRLLLSLAGGTQPPAPASPEVVQSTQVAEGQASAKIIALDAAASRPVNSGQHSRRQEPRPRVSEYKEMQPNPDGQVTLDLAPWNDWLGREKFQRVRYSLLAVLAIGVLAFIYYANQKGHFPTNKIHLLGPQSQGARLSEEAAKKSLAKALAAFQRDTFEGYRDAQNELVRLLEGSERNLDAKSLLCMTHRGLWPFAYQDSADVQVLRSVAQVAYAEDPLSPKGVSCRVSQLLLMGQMDSALGMTEAVLEGFPGSEIFYLFKGELLGFKRDYATALGYVQKAAQLAPNWLRPRFLYASYKMELGEFAEAEKSLREILGANPKHALAKLQLAKLELNYLRRADSAKTLVLSALNQSSKLAPVDEANGRLFLARIFRAENDLASALREAQRCNSLMSSLKECRELVVQLGGAVDRTKNLSRESIYLGDEYVKMGDCFAAQAEYKAAFDANNKNALAAYKAAQCLWQLNFGREAIEWMQKAVRADPQMVDGYVALADYLAQQFDYESAYRTLAQLQKLKPRDYRLNYGYALVDFRRRDYKSAIQRLELARKVYDADVELYILSAKSHLALRRLSEAQSAGARAIELDLNNFEAHCVYGRVLAALRGPDAGLDYLRPLSADFPQITAYQLTIAEILSDGERWSEAREILERLAKVSEHKDILLLLASVRQKLGDLNGARQALMAAATLTLSSGDPEALFRLGQLYLSTNQGGTALKQFKRVFDINPRFPQVNSAISEAQLQLGNPELALDFARKEQKLNPFTAQPYLLAAAAFERLGQFGNCAAEFQKAAKLRPQDSSLYIRLASCYRKASNDDLAIAALKLAARAEPGNPNIYRELGAVYETKGDVAAMVAAYERYLNLLPSAPDRVLIEAKMQK